MRFLKRKAPKTSEISLSALTLPSGSLLSVVGESHYQPALEMTAKIATRGQAPLPVQLPIVDEEPELLWFQAVLVREPDNEYDSNAIAVHSTRGKIGHLSRDDAELYQDVLLEIERQGSQAAACSAFLRRADNGNWGVVLALSHADYCLDDLGS
jgi:hypothetical protein